MTQATTQQRSIKDQLREWNLSDIIQALGVSDLLDAIDSHAICDHLVYVAMHRKGEQRAKVFRREVLSLAQQITLESLIDEDRRGEEEERLDNRERATTSTRWVSTGDSQSGGGRARTPSPGITSKSSGGLNHDTQGSSYTNVQGARGPAGDRTAL